MIEQKQFIVFGRGKQKEFLQNVKSSLNSTWKELIDVSGITKSMFFKYLNEDYPINKTVFDILLTKTKQSSSTYSYNIL